MRWAQFDGVEFVAVRDDGSPGLGWCFVFGGDVLESVVGGQVVVEG